MTEDLSTEGLFARQSRQTAKFHERRGANNGIMSPVVAETLRPIIQAGGKKWGVEPIGKLMIVQLNANQFIVIGSLCHITFHPVGRSTGKAWQYLRVEEGRYVNGVFKPLRILNGDETDWGGPRFGETPTVLQVTLTTR